MLLDRLTERKISAANHLSRVEPIALALEKVADNMDKDGIGGHPTRGHATFLRSMAAAMRVDATSGKIPHEYNSTGHYSAASVHAATDPLAAAFAPILDDLKHLSSGLDALGRKPIAPNVAELLRTLGLADDGRRIEPEKLDAVFASTAKHLSTQKRIEIRTALAHAGILD
jgi:hypothetical protein